MSAFRIVITKDRFPEVKLQNQKRTIFKIVDKYGQIASTKRILIFISTGYIDKHSFHFFYLANSGFCLFLIFFNLIGKSRFSLLLLVCSYSIATIFSSLSQAYLELNLAFWGIYTHNMDSFIFWGHIHFCVNLHFSLVYEKLLTLCENSFLNFCHLYLIILDLWFLIFISQICLLFCVS